MSEAALLVSDVSDTEVSDAPYSATQFVEITQNGKPFALSCGAALPQAVLAYQSWGRLNASADNAILVFHAFSGSAHAAGYNPLPPSPDLADMWNDDCYVGWWDGFIGPGKALDTDRYFVLCANYIGGCYGSTGPRSINPENGELYRADFPAVGLTDVVDSQVELLRRLGIKKLHAALGPSLGGVLALNLVTRYPHLCDRVIPIGSGLRVTALQKILNFEQILAIESDPHFQGGYYQQGRGPQRGLALARMIAHKTFIAPEALNGRARKTVEQSAQRCSWYEISDPIESYMLYQGEKFLSRFDANAYLRILKMWQSIDLCRDAGTDGFTELFQRCSGKRFLVLSIDTDYCFPHSEQELLANMLNQAGARAIHTTVQSTKGHDAFLVQPELFERSIGEFLAAA